jgi:hypothetical protein
VGEAKRIQKRPAGLDRQIRLHRAKISREQAGPKLERIAHWKREVR